MLRIHYFGSKCIMTFWDCRISWIASAVQEFGQCWAKVSGSVGRSEQDCRDRYLNHIASSHVRGEYIPTTTELEPCTTFQLTQVNGPKKNKTSWSKLYINFLCNKGSLSVAMVSGQKSVKRWGEIAPNDSAVRSGSWHKRILDLIFIYAIGRIHWAKLSKMVVRHSVGLNWTLISLSISEPLHRKEMPLLIYTFHSAGWPR